MSTATTSATTSAQGATGWQQDWRWLVAWSMLAIVLVAINRTSVGRVIVYYALALMIVFLLVTQFAFFRDALAPFANLGPGLTAGQGPQGEK